MNLITLLVPNTQRKHERATERRRRKWKVNENGRTEGKRPISRKVNNTESNIFIKQAAPFKLLFFEKKISTRRNHKNLRVSNIRPFFYS